jgi:tRNA pseudouridine38/39 synthase
MRPSSILCLQQVAFLSFYPIRRPGLPRRTTMSRQPSPPNCTSSEPHTSDPPNYETWTREELITRLKELTAAQGATSALSSTTSSSSSSSNNPPAPAPDPNLNLNLNLKPKSSNPKKQQNQKQNHPRREFNFSAYPTRKIALKFSYAGSGFGGLAWQTGPTPLPTVEGELFAALAKARLVDPQGGLEGCGWERCGRTDRGVSAAGQVVSLYLRCSNRPSSSLTVEETSAGHEGEDAENGADDVTPLQQTVIPEASSSLTGITEGGVKTTAAEQQTSSKKDLLRYLHTLNAILPPSIRVYAWAPVAPAFSARFSCRARHYKYFFSARNLDVDAMRNAATRLVGEHDFRNLSKLDPAKQLTSFRRRILRADISPLDDDHKNNGVVGRRDMHVLDLVGTAFLYNQVRHIMAVLLLIGARLESPSVISALMNVDPNNGNGGDDDGYREEAPPPVVTCKPEYQMADALPLVLWDCVYAPEDAPWRTDDADIDGGSAGLHLQLAGLAERAQVEAALAEHFLTVASQFHAPPPALLRQPGAGERGPWDIPLGGGMVRREGKYVPLLKRKRLESVEVVNARWRTRKG